jgi:hypothetical protein
VRVIGWIQALAHRESLLVQVECAFGFAEQP